MIRLYIDKIGSDCYDTDKKKTKEVLLKSPQRSGGSSPERRRNLRKAGTLQWELNRFISERDIERSCCTDPQKLDQKSNIWRSVFLCLSILLNSKRKLSKKFGDAGLIRSRKSQTYSFEKKLSVVELYLSSEISYQDLALQEGITNPSMIVNWVNRFRVVGPDALKPHKKGRRKTLEKSEKNSSTLPIESQVDTSAEHVKELEDELLKLRIENAFLKELRRLRLEDEAKMRERRESSTASEDSSN